MSLIKKVGCLLFLSVAIFVCVPETLAQISPYQLSPKWRFGYNAGIDFNGTPSVPTATAASANNTTAPEGSTSICNPAGTLVFYSDAITLRNGAQNISLLGGNSATQGAVAIPDPADRDNKYYVFTAGDLTGNSKKGLYWHHITKTGTTVNVIAKDSLAAKELVDESLCAGVDGAGGYWIIAHGQGVSEIWVWHVTASGISGPDKQATPTYTQGSGNGSVKLSQCQDRLAWIGNGNVHVLNWNRTTGKIGTNICPVVAVSGGISYGIEFSPNGQMVYYTNLNGAALRQINTATGASTLIATGSSNSTQELGTMQLGPDGKIYVTNASWYGSTGNVGVVRSPNLAGTACDYSSTGFVLASSTFTYRGIANIAWLNPNLPVVRKTSEQLCPNNEFGFAYDFKNYFNNDVTVVGQEWDFGDGSAKVMDLAPIHSFPMKSTDETYTVTVKVTDNTCNQTWTASLQVLVPASPCGGQSVTAQTPVCPDASAQIKVTGVKIGEEYQVVRQGTITPALGSQIVTTLPTDDTLRIATTGLTEGVNTLTVLVKKVGSSSFVSLGDVSVVMKAKPKDVTIDPATQTICLTDNTAKIKVYKFESGFDYSVTLNNTAFATTQVIDGDTIIFTLPNVPAGDHKVGVVATLAGCGNYPKGVVDLIVNPPVDTNKAVAIDTICVGMDAYVVISNPQSRVTYSAYLDHSLSPAGSGPSPVRIPGSNFPAVANHFVMVTGSIPGCPVDTLHQTDTVYVIRLDKNIAVSKDTITVCANGSNATIQIYDPQPKVVYSYKGNSVKAPYLPVDSIALVIPVQDLNNGLNTITVGIRNAACSDTLLAHAYIIKINQVEKIIGDTLICRSKLYDFTASPLVYGARSYTWSTKHRAVLSNPVTIGGADSSQVTFDFSAVTSATDSVYVSVNGDSACVFPSVLMKVRLFDPLIAPIIKDDTTCTFAYGPDSVRYTVATPLSNAPKYRWDVVDGPFKTIVKYHIDEVTGLPDSSKAVQIAFPAQARTVDSIGVDLKIIPFSVCDDKYDDAMAVIKHITFLPVPDANAGKDVDTTTVVFPQIVLDGSKAVNGRPASSLNPDGKSFYQYSWIPQLNGSLLVTPDKIRTLLQDQKEVENSYTLTVWNRGQCASSDTVNVKVKLLVNVPNAFTPNGDNVNDYWEIRNLEYFPNNKLVVYNQWGSKVYEATPYHNNWDGAHNGEKLPIGTYYYVLDLNHEGLSPMAGSVTIVK